MFRWKSIGVVLGLLVMIAVPVQAQSLDEFLKITGFIDNHIRYIDNISTNEEDNGRGDNGNLTTDDDDQFSGRTRGRLFINLSPNTFSKAVFGFEFDQEWGDDTGDGGGFDFGNDNNAFELKHLYVDINVPKTPLRVQVGGFAVNGTRLKRCVVFCDDAGGIAVHGDWSPQIKTYTWYLQAEEELIEAGPDLLGEDFTVGTRVEVSPLKGLDVDLFLAYYHIDGPSSDSSSLMVGSCSAGRDGGAGAGGGQCFERDTRFYVGLDGRWKLGAVTLSPTLLLTFGERKLAGGGEADIAALLLDIRASYKTGPFTITGKFVYTPGNDADDDLSDGDDINFWQNITVTTVHRSVQWFELIGWNFDSTSNPPFGFNNSRATRSAATFDQFGLVHPAVKADYSISKPLTVSGALGLFFAAEDVGAPARFGGAPPASYNWTGDDKYLGTEVDVWLTWQAFKGTTINVWFAYAFTGDAQDLCAPGTGGTTGVGCDVQEAEDQVGAGARMIYRF